jgi:hypothetical protein
MTRRELSRNAAGAILEHNFGWQPLIQDVYDSFEVLSQPLPGGKAYGSASSGLSWERVQYDGPGGKDWYVYNCVVRHQAYAEVYLTNPNLFLLNQLGLLNPAQIAWELIPFSFLVDWAFDVQNFLGSFTDFVGCDVLNPGYSVYVKGVAEHISVDHYDQSWNQLYLHRITESSRVPALPTPVPSTQVILNLKDSKRRAVNAASLLTQLLTGIRG